MHNTPGLITDVLKKDLRLYTGCKFCNAAILATIFIAVIVAGIHVQ